MKDFPEFMKTPENSIAPKSQSEGARGWVYEGIDGKQMAYWVCERDGVSQEHVHEFDEYFTVVQGKYTVIIDGRKIDVCKGDEYLIPRNVPHGGEFISGTRTVHCFGGKRADRASQTAGGRPGSPAARQVIDGENIITEYPWQYDETAQVGADYSDENEVRAYDLRMARLRDVEKEISDIAPALDLDADSTVWEIGTGTGECALGLSRYCKKVFATDVSPAMLSYARHKAQQRGIDNVAFQLGGFLSGFQPDAQVDGIVSQLALHHLPDFWKSRALAVIERTLCNGGRFYLRDVVFPSTVDDHNAFFEGIVSSFQSRAGDEVAQRIIRHIRAEYSTLDWILEGMIERSGLKVTHKNSEGFFTVYVCEK